MIIKDMFKKAIDRNIDSVVKPSKIDKDVLKQEFEEYVVTKQLQGVFASFFAAYQYGINNKTDKMGVWIAGDYGSGKSHMLKMLSYLLSHKEVYGKTALEYFLEDNKIKDPKVIADMKNALKVPTDSILFDIDAKSKTAGRKDKRVLVNTFLTVFNEHLGYCSSNLYVADLERHLEELNKFKEFKGAFERLTGKAWEDSRNKFNFIMGKVKKVLIEIDAMDEDSANNWADSTKIPYEIKIEDFAKIVKKHIDKMGNNHHVVFFVDEVSQYIGNNTDLILNLQTLVQQLSTHCEGKAWVVVTSQVELEGSSSDINHDYSKIQGRFATKITLNSSDVAEVIKKRILEKKESAKDSLKIIYTNNETIIRNKMAFTGTVEQKFYENEEDFAQIYPFLPYQFDLVSKVIKGIKRNSSAGKYQSQGERSMLALFQNSVKSLMNNESDSLASFNLYYESLSKDLDVEYSSVIDNAYKNNEINPDKGQNCFNVEVLKVLLMIKHVNEIKKRIEDITTLMISKIDEDIIILKEKVKEALDILCRQMLVQKNGNEYYFLTDAEQEVEKIIDSQHVKANEITGKIAEEIFGKIFTDKKYSYPKFSGRYNFGFDKQVDDYLEGKKDNEIKVLIITPESDYYGDNAAVSQISMSGDSVCVVLPESTIYLNEFQQVLKIDKFIRSSEASSLINSMDIISKKTHEREDHKARAEVDLKEALKNAKYYINGSEVNFKGKDFLANVREGLKMVVDIIYGKLNYITAAKEIADIEKMFKDNSNTISLMSAGDIKDNELAIRDVVDYVKVKSQRYAVSLNDVKANFAKPQYGFTPLDVEWIVAKCFKDSVFEFKFNNEVIALTTDTKQIIDYIVKSSNDEKLLISIKVAIDSKKIKVLKDISKELFKMPLNMQDTDEMANVFKKYSDELQGKIKILLKNYEYSNYPGKKVLQDGEKLLTKISGMKYATEIFDCVYKNRDEYDDLIDDYEPVKNFFKGPQKATWDKAKKIVKLFEDSKTFINDKEIETVIADISKIFSRENPYALIKDLPPLIENFNNIYLDLLEKEAAPIKKASENAQKQVIDNLNEGTMVKMFEEANESNILKNLAEKFNEKYSELSSKIDTCNNIKDLKGYNEEIKSLRSRCLTETETKYLEIQKKLIVGTQPLVETPPYPIGLGSGATPHPIVHPKTTLPKIKTRKIIKASEINDENFWVVKNEVDLERYLNAMKKKIESKMDEDTILNIEF